MLRKIWFFTWGIAILTGGSLAFSQGIDLQALIDSASPGDVVEVPAGVYYGNFKLKEGVILSGAGASVTTLDGRGDGAVIDGATGSIVKGFTLTNGIIGVKTNGHFMGVFENIIQDSYGSGICTGGAPAVIVNNLIIGNRGKGGIESGRSNIVAVNNTLCGNKVGLDFWKAGGSRVVNNIIAYSESGVLYDDEPLPKVQGNLFWANTQDLTPWESAEGNILSDPHFRNAGAGDYRPLPNSPVIGAGSAVEGLPPELTADIGCRLPASFPLEVYQALMEAQLSSAPAGQSSILYELLDEVGSFRVTTRFPRPSFKITSSTPATTIANASAFDSVSNENLISQVKLEEPPCVEVAAVEGQTYPEEEGRYVMESVFSKPDSYFNDAEGKIHFQRQTNINNIQVLIPAGYGVESAEPEAAVDQGKSLVSFANPAGEMVSINLVFSPLTN